MIAHISTSFNFDPSVTTFVVNFEQKLPQSACLLSVLEHQTIIHFSNAPLHQDSCIPLMCHLAKSSLSVIYFLPGDPSTTIISMFHSYIISERV